MILPFNIDLINKMFENETPEERTARYAENKARTARYIASWRKFEEEFPEVAKQMTC